ncbi:BTB/POZ domain-containing protein 17 isoform X1 [Paramormyrops kingsleyae]|uniref:BTB domain containing 17 n=1 Tax=Paramormyrops kingsleyae TaxID=1676925 RepID=A0A3B3SWR5_9TELE|nr:BTB/POZ domain-containing protein 17 [Paramormyrops kingsleyae]
MLELECHMGQRGHRAVTSLAVGYTGTLRERRRTKQKRITPRRESKQGATRPEMAFAFQGGFPAGICGVILLTFSMQAAMVSGAVLRQEAVLDNSAALINHSMALVQRMEALLIQGNGSDVSLRVQTTNSDEVKVIQAHSLVLSLQSEVFEELLLTLNGSVLTLREAADCAAVFDKFIRYLYCGELLLRLEQAVPLHKLATKYHVQALRRGLSLYMSQHLASDSPASHVVGWYQYAAQTGDTALRDSCLQYLSWNLSTALQSGEWGILGSELLLSLLQRSDLVLHSELELYEALEAWVGRNQPTELTAEAALRSIRYGMIPPQQLFRLQKQSPLMLKHQESVRDLLYLAFQFHSASPTQLAKYFDVNCSIFTPRNYLSAAWGAQWVINNPTRDDRSTSFQTQLGPSGHDAGKRVTWNALFSPRWLPLSTRSAYADGSAVVQASRADGGRPRIVITPATSSADFAGVSFQKTVIVAARQQGKVVVRHIYNFHQSTEETGDFLAEADLQRRASEYLIDSSLYLHIVVKPLYHSLIVARK